MRLRAILRESVSCVIAFSGGVDSAFLARVAFDELGKDALAVTMLSPFLSVRERREARALAAAIGIRHRFLHQDFPPTVFSNPADRCYLCKRLFFRSLKRFARLKGFAAVFDGSNVDDLRDFRPGAKALRELKVRSPLQETGLTKAEIRFFSRRLGLPSWDKPSLACLASRFPHDEEITGRKLAMVEKAEEWLHSMGLRQLRVRFRDGTARIEAERSGIRLLLARRAEVSLKFRALGFTRVSVDLDGYGVGAMNVTKPWTEKR